MANASSGRIFMTCPADHFGPINAEHDPTFNKVHPLVVVVLVVVVSRAPRVVSLPHKLSNAPRNVL